MPSSTLRDNVVPTNASTTMMSATHHSTWPRSDARIAPKYIIFTRCANVCEAAFVATTPWRFILEGKKNTSSKGPETPDNSDRTVQTTPHAKE